MLCRAAAPVAALILAWTTLATPAAATYPGRNGRISFSRWEEPNVSVLTARPDGSDARVIASGGALHESSWSPNGKRIVYVKGTSSFLPNKLCVMLADGSNSRCIVSKSSRSIRELHSPSFLPGGQRIVYSDWGSRPRSYTVNLNGGDRREFAPHLDGYKSGIKYAPNGRHVAFSYQPEGQDHAGIYTMRVGGGGLRRIARRGGDVDWSPDSRRLVFTRMSDDKARVNIYRIGRDGAALRRLTDARNGVYFEGPVWSPNGRWIVYQKHGGEDSIRMMRPDGSRDHTVLGGDPMYLEPSWQPLPD